MKLTFLEIRTITQNSFYYTNGKWTICTQYDMQQIQQKHNMYNGSTIGTIETYMDTIERIFTQDSNSCNRKNNRHNNTVNERW